MHRQDTRRRLSLPACAFALIACLSPAASASPLGLGTPISSEQLRHWDIDVSADGTGLPAGRGSVVEGKTVYQAKCAACHGAAGEGGIGDALAGGKGTLATAKPVKTIGSYWPYATTLFDYIRRAMPFGEPQSLSSEDVYAVSAYLLHLNGIVAADTVLDAASLPKVRMPNREGFEPK
ncbi:c-type cytochrome [Noviherbaspirillum malthae]|uniref:c-type cytochrome n=1 Tax=Noviherbaspirillum malthae TaxID=1260987 RepID=UPI00189044C8|nr:cytochrome c [Noviherbaspirillum malthae]